MHSGNKLRVVTFGTKRRRSLGNICKHRSMERSGVKCFHCTHVFDLTKGEKRRNVGKLNNELNIVNQLVDLHFLLFVNITGNWKNRLAHTRQIIIADWLSLSESSWCVFITRGVHSSNDHRHSGTLCDFRFFFIKLCTKGNSNNTAPSIGTIAGWGLELSFW